MHRTHAWWLACLAAATTHVAAQEGYKVDESKLPEWVKRQGNSPYKAILDSSTVHIKAASRAASAGVARAKPTESATAATAAKPPAAVAATAGLSASVPVAAAASRPAPATAAANLPVEKAAFVATPAPATLPLPAPEASLQAVAAVTPPATKAAPVAAQAPTIGTICPAQVLPTMPARAAQQGIGGTVKARAVVQDGEVKAVKIVSGPAIFHAAVRDAMKRYRCQPGDTPVTVDQDFVFELE